MEVWRQLSQRTGSSSVTRGNAGPRLERAQTVGSGEVQRAGRVRQRQRPARVPTPDPGSGPRGRRRGDRGENRDRSRTQRLAQPGP